MLDHRAVVTFDNERAVTSNQCLRCSLAWWPAEWTEATASDWLPLDIKEGWGLGANSFWKVEELWRQPSYSLLENWGPNGRERTFQHFHHIFQTNSYFIWIFGFWWPELSMQWNTRMRYKHTSKKKKKYHQCTLPTQLLLHSTTQAKFSTAHLQE